MKVVGGQVRSKCNSRICATAQWHMLLPPRALLPAAALAAHIPSIAVILSELPQFNRKELKKVSRLGSSRQLYRHPHPPASPAQSHCRSWRTSRQHAQACQQRWLRAKRGRNGRVRVPRTINPMFLGRYASMPLPALYAHEIYTAGRSAVCASSGFSIERAYATQQQITTCCCKRLFPGVSFRSLRRRRMGVTFFCKPSDAPHPWWR